MVTIDRRSGKRVYGAWPTDEAKAAVIWEAFKPDTEPRRSTRQDEVDSMREEIMTLLRRGRQAETRRAARPAAEQPENFAEEQGGLY